MYKGRSAQPWAWWRRGFVLPGYDWLPEGGWRCWEASDITPWLASAPAHVETQLGTIRGLSGRRGGQSPYAMPYVTRTDRPAEVETIREWGQ